MADGRSCTACFLGTGNFLATSRYWNSFVLDGTVLVEPSPTSLPHLRRCGLRVAELDIVVISHFHADHTFGWPFLLLALAQEHRGMPLHVVGPPGVEAYLQEMLRVGGVLNVGVTAAERLDIAFVEADGSWQDAGPLRFRAVAVDHVPHLDCYGFLFERGSRIVGYSGDTKPCPGLEEIAGSSDVLIVECNGAHPPPPVPVTHLDLADVEALRARHPTVPFVLTHLGQEPDLDRLPRTTVPRDFETLEL